MTSLSRRTVMQIGASALAAAPLAKGGTGGGNAFQAASYGDVTLLDGPMQAQFAAHHRTLLAMDDDALLKPFREAAGLPALGDDLGGWYNRSPSFNAPADFHGFIPGHSFGQYVSGMARAYAITGDPATKAKVHRLVDGFAPTITSKFYDNYPLPAYTYDKISIGLLDAFAFAGKTDALDLLNRATDAALPHLPEKALTRPEQEARPHPGPAWTWDETYTLPENLYLAYKRGAGSRFRALAARYLLDKDYFDPLAAGQNVLPGRHAYSHMNALSSAMQAWLTDGSAKHFKAAKNGFDMIVAQSYATGGWGPNETYQVPGSGGLGDMLNATHAGFETPCGSYGHFKAVRYLMSATGDSRYGDTMERVLYNAILGALPMKPDGTAFYYSDYNMTGTKFYHEYKCTCCSGTLGQVVADYAMNTFYTNRRGVVVNLYTPSEFRWRRGGRTVTLRQTTQYPLAGEVAIEVRTPTVEQFSVYLRVPAWAGKGTTIAVNDRRLATSPAPGRFFEVHRSWKNGDRIALALDMPLTLEAVDSKHPNLVAVMQGPLALFAVGDRFLPFRRDELLKVRQVAANSTGWRVETGDGVQTFKPFFAIGAGEATRLYQPLPA
ncbi:MAG TPA: beta-L-arabinofuranosidase domain-containing protein [Rhizomicrobium sp.]|nr:beta-L-arabinofuranosidase domain-containing protein [Rhizomicrobium sp.]